MVKAMKIFPALTVVIALVSNGARAEDAPKPFLGLSYSESNQPPGVLVNYTVPGGPAQKAGLQRQDVITKINGRPASFKTFNEVVGRSAPGDKLDLEVIRGEKEQKFQVAVVQRTKQLSIIALKTEKLYMELASKQLDVQYNTAAKLADDYDKKLSTESMKEKPSFTLIIIYTQAHTEWKTTATIAELKQTAVKERLANIETELAGLEDR
jgi:hypothetical protein